MSMPPSGREPGRKYSALVKRETQKAAAEAAAQAAASGTSTPPSEHEVFNLSFVAL